jgi:hypothetical protein
MIYIETVRSYFKCRPEYPVYIDGFALYDRMHMDMWLTERKLLSNVILNHALA